MLLLRIALVTAAVFYAQPATSVEPDEVLQDPALEQRARALSRELRCMVCQNQSIDDSNAPLARDLRVLVRERIQAGDSNDQVIGFLTARYGDFVLLRPRLGWHTVVLWTAPFAILLAGAAGVFFAARRRANVAPPAPQLTEEEQRRLANLTETR
jgi:cytochrome c-type biogenesis protein CcmH